MVFEYDSLVVQVCISALADFVNETHLEQIINHFEHHVFGVEPVEWLRHLSVDIIEV